LRFPPVWAKMAAVFFMAEDRFPFPP